MAARINTRLILIIIIVLGVIGAVGVGLKMFVFQKTAEDFTIKGDELYNDGKPTSARLFYERAIGKDPKYVPALEKYEKTILERVPASQTEAEELLLDHVQLLAHYARNFPYDYDAHERFASTLLGYCKVGEVRYWSALQEAAEQMMQHAVELEDTSPGDAADYLGDASLAELSEAEFVELREKFAVGANLYLGITQTAPVEALTASREREEFDEGLAALERHLELVPDSDAGWSARVEAEAWLQEEGYDDETRISAQRQADAVEAMIAKARAATNDGLQVLNSAALLHMRAASRGIDPLARSRALEEVQLLADRGYDVDDPTTVIQICARLLAAKRFATSGNEIPSPAPMLERFFDNPDHASRIDLRVIQAQVALRENRFDDADAAANLALDVPELSTSILAVLQPRQRVVARALRVETAILRWDQAIGEDRGVLANAFSERVEELRSEPAGAARDVFLADAEAKLSYVQGDYLAAAAKFEELIADGAKISGAQTLALAATSLSKIDQPGRARQLIERALEDFPNDKGLLITLARIQKDLGEVDAARLTIAEIGDMQDPRVQEILRGLPGSNENVSPVDAAIREASSLAERGEAEKAIEDLNSLLTDSSVVETDGHRAQIFFALSRLHYLLGDAATSLELAEQSLELAPQSTTAAAWIAELNSSDLAEAVVQTTLVGNDGDERKSIIQIIARLRVLETRTKGRIDLAKEIRDEEKVAEQEELLGLTQARLAEWWARAEAEVTGTTDLTEQRGWAELRFRKALEEKNWTLAETIAEEVADADLDSTGGRFFSGRLKTAQALASENPTDARRFNEEAAAVYEQVTEELPFSSEGWKALARANERLGALDDAAFAYGRAYENNPRALDIILRYVQLLRETGESQQALQIARDALRRFPRNQPLRSIVTVLEAEYGNMTTVILTRRQWLKENPDNNQNAALLAVALARTTPSRATIVNENLEPRYSVVRWDSLDAEARQAILDDERNRWRDEADRLAQSVEPDDKASPMFILWSLLRAEIERSRGDVEAGAAWMQAAVDAQDSDEGRFDALVVFGRYLQKIDIASAIQAFEAARDIRPEGRLEPESYLSEIYTELKDYDRAIEAVEGMVELLDGDTKRVMLIDLAAFELPRRPINPVEVQRVLVRLRLQGGDIPEARAALDDMLANRSPTFEDLLLGASILSVEADDAWKAQDDALAQAKESEINEVIAAAEALSPNDARAPLLASDRLRRAYQRSGDIAFLDEAMEILNEASTTVMNRTTIARQRIAILRSKRDGQAVLEEFKQLLQATPEDEQIRSDYITELIAQGRLTDAERSYKDAIEYFGDRQEAQRWRFGLGNFLLEQRDNAREALAVYKPAWDATRNPAFLAGYCRALLAVRPPEYNQVVRLLEGSETEMNERPVLRNVFARALAGVGNQDAALEQFAKSYARINELVAAGQAAPGSIARWVNAVRQAAGDAEMAQVEAFLRSLAGDELTVPELAGLAQAWFAAGDVGRSKSIDLISEALERTPQEDTATRGQLWFTLAGFNLAIDRKQAAAEAFEKCIELQPNNALALNNAAYLKATEFDKPEEAMDMAERAVAMRPTDWAILDTTGYIAFLAGDMEKAERYLEWSLSIREAPDNLFHYAELLAQSEDSNLLRDARTRLERASELNESRNSPDSELRGKIDRLSDQIRSRLSG